MQKFFFTWNLDDDIRLSTMQHIAETKKESPSSEESFTDDDGSAKKEESNEVLYFQFLA